MIALSFDADTVDKYLNFGCGGLDVICKVNEQVAVGMAMTTGWLADATLGAQNFNTGSALWGVATSQAGLWLGLSVLVMLITSAVGISVAAITGRGDLMKRAIIGAFLSFPTTMFAYFIVGKGLDVIDELSDGLLATLTGTRGGFGAMVESIMWSGSGIEGFIALTSGGVQWMHVLLVLLAMMLGVLFVAFSIAFRNFVLMLLIAFAPLAFVLLPVKGGGVWVKRWISAVVAMALSKPLILGTLALVMAGFSSIGSVWKPEGVTLLIGFVIAAFMPLMAYGFFNFIGGDGGAGDQVGSRAAGSAKQNVQQTRQNVQQHRDRQRERVRGGGSGSRPGAGPGSGGTLPQTPRVKPSEPKTPSKPSVPKTPSKPSVPKTPSKP